MFVNKYILKRRLHFDFKSNFQHKMFDKMFFTLYSLIINFFNIFFYNTIHTNDLFKINLLFGRRAAS